MYQFNYNGGSNHLGKFLCLVVTGGQEVFLSSLAEKKPSYHNQGQHFLEMSHEQQMTALFGGIHGVPASKTINKFELAQAYIKLFIQWERVPNAQQMTSYSFYFQLAAETDGANLVTIKHPVIPEWEFRGRGRFLLKKEIRQILAPDSQSLFFALRQPLLPRDELRRMITIKKEKLVYSVGRRIAVKKKKRS